MSLDNPGIYFDASCSWNGFNHQGKLAIWYSLKQIEELFDCKKRELDNLELLNTYFLEIEYIEDFSIGRVLDGGVIEYISVHQVKNHEKGNLSEYKGALLGLAFHVREKKNLQNAYLHTTKSVNIGTKTLLEHMQDMVNNPSDLRATLREIDNIRHDSEKKQELINPRRKGTSDFKRKLLEAYKESENLAGDKIKLNNSNLDDALSALEKKTNDQKLVCSSMDDSLLSKVSFFKYNIEGKEQLYCEVNQIESLLKAQIKKLNQKLSVCKDYWNSDEYVNRRYMLLLKHLDEHIIERNLNFPLYKSSEKDRKIYLKTIYQWMVDPEIERQSDDFFLYHLKESFLSIIDDYCSKRCNADNEQCASCTVRSFDNKIGCMSFKKMREFLCFTNPTVYKEMSMITYPLYIDKHGIINPFIKGLQTIPVDFDTDNTAVLYRDENRLSHVLTTIFSDSDGSDAPIVCSDIIKNRGLYEVLMDFDYFISKDIAVKSIQTEALKCGFEYEERDKEHIAKFKDVAIETLDGFIKNVK